MAKLIKLSTTTDQNRTGNSFNCLSDEDIMIEANSKISLLNCQISSGILKDYKINGTDMIDGEMGEIWATLNLVQPDPTQNPPSDPNTRRLLLRNGQYNITTLCLEMKRSILNSLVSCSAGGYTSATSATLPMPLNSPDFELAVDVFVNKDNKIEIDFNSKPILTTNDITYSNVKPGVAKDDAGNIYWAGGGALPDEVAIDPTKSEGTSQNCTVQTLGSVVNKFGVGDVGTLLDYQTGAPPTAYTITNIQVVSNNLDSAIDIDETATVIQPDATYLYSLRQRTNMGFKAGDVVSIDDGTSTPGNPSANLTTGTLENVELVYVNEWHNIVPFNGINLNQTFQLIYPNITFITANPDGTWNMDIDKPETEDSIINSWCIVRNTNDRNIAVGQIINESTISGITTKKRLTINLMAIQTGFNVDLNLIIPPCIGGEVVLVSEFFSDVIPGQGAQAEKYPQAQKYWMVEIESGAPFCRLNVDTITEENADEMRISLNTADPGFEIAQGASVINGLAGLERLIRVWDDIWDKYMLVPAYNFKSGEPLDPDTVEIGDGDTIMITTGDEPIQITLTLSSAPELIEINDENFTLFNVAITQPDAEEEWFDSQQLIRSAVLTGIDETLTLFKTNNWQRIEFLFEDGSIANPAVVPLATRIWEGNDITPTYKLTLTRAGNVQNGFELNRYSDLVKGDLSGKYGDKFAFALADEQCNPGAGRAVFVVDTLPSIGSGAEFGIMETGIATFENMGLDSARYSIGIRNRGGNLVYALKKDGAEVALGGGSSIQAFAGDRIAIQWNSCYGKTTFYNTNTGTYESRGDKQYIQKAPSPQEALNNAGRYIGEVPNGNPSAEDREKMRNNITFSVMRVNSLNWTYLGAPANTLTQGSVYPYTPLDNPTQNRVKWNVLKSYAPFIRPGLGGKIRLVELTGNPLTTTDANGVKKPFDGTNYIMHPDYHTPDIEIASNNPTKYTDPANAFILNMTQPRLQKLLGYSEASYSVYGASGSITANKTYLEAYLPENILVMLDTAPSITTYDCGQTQGKRRQIVCCAVNTQSITGDINIEPSNLYRISLGNKVPLNSRKFTVSFETFYGEQIILANAKATVNLLVEPPE